MRERTGGRRTGPDTARPPERSEEKWVDLGRVGGSRPSRGRSDSVRGRSKGPSERAAVDGERQTRRPATATALDNVVQEFERRVGGRLAQRALKTYERALASFEAHRYAEARGQLVPLAREYGDVSAVHDLLGLCLYREEKWKQAIKSLEEVRRIDPGNIHNNPVLADCYRAIGEHDLVKALWLELADSSPTAEAVAEGRIVYAGSLMDQGLLDEALELMRKSDTVPRRVEERHLRLWYVLADIHDKRGDIVAARKVFTRILQHDADFADVAERLSVLGD